MGQTILKFSCDLKILSQTINNVSLAINKKINPLPILEGILLECDNENLKLIGFDLNLAIIKKIKIKTQIAGRIVINAQLFSDILKKMKGSEILVSCNEKFKIEISDEETKFNIVGNDSQQFPKIFEIGNGNKFKIKNLVLQNMIFQSSFAVAQIPGQNPVLCGSLFKFENGRLFLISLDGYRVAISNHAISNVSLNSQFIVSSKTLNEIFKLLNDVSDNDDETEIEFNEKYAVFKINGYHILTRLLEGKFLDYEAAIPKKSSTILKIDPKELIIRIERVSVLVTNRVSVILKIRNSHIELNCESSLGNVNDVLNVQIEGKPIEKIAFNFKYMLDALKHTQTDKVKISFNDALSPIKIEPEEGNEFLFLVLPVRI